MRIVIMVLGTVLFLLPSVARAALVYVTYEGTARGIDQAGSFGQAGASVDGKAFTVKYIFDVVYGQNNMNCNACLSSPNAHYIVGGISFGNPLFALSPLQSFSVTVGNITLAFDGSYYGAISNENDGPFAAIFIGHEAMPAAHIHLSTSIRNTTGDLPPQLLLPDYHYTVKAGDTASGAYCANSDCIMLDIATLDITTQPPDPTPLPAAIALFPAGLGLLGVMAYRRKRQQTV